jgi:hypothetical protein
MLNMIFIEIISLFKFDIQILRNMNKIKILTVMFA